MKCVSFCRACSRKPVKGKRKGLDEELNRVEEIFSKLVTESVFSRWTVEHMSKAYRHPGRNIHNQNLLQFQSVMFSLLPKPPILFLHRDVGEMYDTFRAILVSVDNQGVHLDHFKLFVEREPTKTEDTAKIYSAKTSQELWEREIIWIEVSYWCRPLSISGNHVLILNIRLGRKEASNLQEKLDECKIYRKPKKEPTRSSEE